MKKALSPHKVFSATLSLVFFTANCAFAHRAETTLWEDRQRAVKNSAPTQLAHLPANIALSNPASVLQKFPNIQPSFPPQLEKSIPASAVTRLTPLFRSLSTAYGSVQKVVVPKTPKSNRTIIHIQDVHMNAEAQQNIEKAVQGLIDGNHVDLIALEGAFAPIDLTAFRSFPQESTRKVANYLFRENKISGPIYAAFTNPKPVPSIVGIDDPIHYKANVESYRRSVSEADEYKRRLNSLKDRLASKKKKLFNSLLYDFDLRAQGYRDGHLSLGSYIEFLSQQTSEFSPAFAEATAGKPTIEIFLEAFRLESTLDFAAVEKERGRLLSQLLAKLSASQTQGLVAASVAYQLGNISHADFYTRLKTLCTESGILLSRFPAMTSYLQYVLLTDHIDAENLFRDLKKMESKVYASLTQTENEKQLIAESEKLSLTGKLLDFALTKDEWEEYKAVIPAKAGIQALNNPLKMAQDLGPGFRRDDLKSFESFYVEAEARDQAMSENLLKAMNESNAKVAVLVTGGFHSVGIGELIKQAGITMISFAPKITKVDSESGSAYLSVFAQEKTPLDQLFEGEKLFLANNPAQIAEWIPLAWAIDKSIVGSTPLQMREAKRDAGFTELEVTNPETHRLAYLSVWYNAKEIVKVAWRAAPVREYFKRFLVPTILIPALLTSLAYSLGKPITFPFLLLVGGLGFSLFLIRLKAYVSAHHDAKQSERRYLAVTLPILAGLTAVAFAALFFFVHQWTDSLTYSLITAILGASLLNIVFHAGHNPDVVVKVLRRLSKDILGIAPRVIEPAAWSENRGESQSGEIEFIKDRIRAATGLVLSDQQAEDLVKLKHVHQQSVRTFLRQIQKSSRQKPLNVLVKIIQEVQREKSKQEKDRSKVQTSFPADFRWMVVYGPHHGLPDLKYATAYFDRVFRKFGRRQKYLAVFETGDMALPSHYLSRVLAEDYLNDQELWEAADKTVKTFNRDREDIELMVRKKETTLRKVAQTLTRLNVDNDFNRVLLLYFADKVEQDYDIEIAYERLVAESSLRGARAVLLLNQAVEYLREGKKDAYLKSIRESAKSGSPDGSARDRQLFGHQIPALLKLYPDRKIIMPRGPAHLGAERFMPAEFPGFVAKGDEFKEEELYTPYDLVHRAWEKGEPLSPEREEEIFLKDVVLLALEPLWSPNISDLAWHRCALPLMESVPVRRIDELLSLFAQAYPASQDHLAALTLLWLGALDEPGVNERLLNFHRLAQEKQISMADIFAWAADQFRIFRSEALGGEKGTSGVRAAVSAVPESGAKIQSTRERYGQSDYAFAKVQALRKEILLQQGMSEVEAEKGARLQTGRLQTLAGFPAGDAPRPQFQRLLSDHDLQTAVAKLPAFIFSDGLTYTRKETPPNNLGGHLKNWFFFLSEGEVIRYVPEILILDWPTNDVATLIYKTLLDYSPSATFEYARKHQPELFKRLVVDPQLKLQQMADFLARKGIGLPMNRATLIQLQMEFGVPHEIAELLWHILPASFKKEWDMLSRHVEPGFIQFRNLVRRHQDSLLDQISEEEARIQNLRDLFPDKLALYWVPGSLLFQHEEPQLSEVERRFFERVMGYFQNRHNEGWNIYRMSFREFEALSVMDYSKGSILASTKDSSEAEGPGSKGATLGGPKGGNSGLAARLHRTTDRFKIGLFETVWLTAISVTALILGLWAGIVHAPPAYSISGVLSFLEMNRAVFLGYLIGAAILIFWIHYLTGVVQPKHPDGTDVPPATMEFWPSLWATPIAFLSFGSLLFPLVALSIETSWVRWVLVGVGLVVGTFLFAVLHGSINDRKMAGEWGRWVWGGLRQMIGGTLRTGIDAQVAPSYGSRVLKSTSHRVVTRIFRWVGGQVQSIIMTMNFDNRGEIKSVVLRQGLLSIFVGSFLGFAAHYGYHLPLLISILISITSAVLVLVLQLLQKGFEQSDIVVGPVRSNKMKPVASGVVGTALHLRRVVERVIAGAGRPLLDPFLEWAEYLAAPLAVFATSHLIYWFGLTAPPEWVLVLSLLIGTVVFFLTHSLIRLLVVTFHGDTAREAANKVRKAYGAKRLSKLTYQQRISRFFDELNFVTFFVFLMVVFGEVANICLTGSSLHPESLFCQALVFTTAFSVAYHLWKNIAFLMGRFEIVPVMGSSGTDREKKVGRPFIYPTADSARAALRAREERNFPNNARALQRGKYKDPALYEAAQRFGISLPNASKISKATDRTPSAVQTELRAREERRWPNNPKALEEGKYKDRALLDAADQFDIELPKISRRKYPDADAVHAELLARDQAGLDNNASALYSGEHRDRVLYKSARRFGVPLPILGGRTAKYSTVDEVRVELEARRSRGWKNHATALLIGAHKDTALYTAVRRLNLDLPRRGISRLKYPTVDAVNKELKAREARGWKNNATELSQGKHNDPALYWAAQRFRIALPRMSPRGPSKYSTGEAVLSELEAREARGWKNTPKALISGKHRDRWLYEATLRFNVKLVGTVGKKYVNADDVRAELTAREERSWANNPRALHSGDHMDSALYKAAKKFGVDLPAASERVADQRLSTGHQGTGGERESTGPQVDTSAVWVWGLRQLGVPNPERIAVLGVGWWAEAILAIGISSIGIVFNHPVWGMAAAIGVLLLVHLKRVVVDSNGELKTQWIWEKNGSRGPPAVILGRIFQHLAAFVFYFSPFFAAAFFIPPISSSYALTVSLSIVWALGSHWARSVHLRTGTAPLFLSPIQFNAPKRLYTGILVLMGRIWLAAGKRLPFGELKNTLEQLTGHTGIRQLSYSTRDGNRVVLNINDVEVESTYDLQGSIQKVTERKSVWSLITELRHTIPIALGAVDPVAFLKKHPDFQNPTISFIRLISLRVLTAAFWFGVLWPVVANFVVILIYGVVVEWWYVGIMSIAWGLGLHLVTHWIQRKLFPGAALANSREERKKQPMVDLLTRLSEGDREAREQVATRYKSAVEQQAVELYHLTRYLAHDISRNVVGISFAVPGLDEFVSEAYLALALSLNNYRDIELNNYISGIIHTNVFSRATRLVSSYWGVSDEGVAQCLRDLKRVIEEPQEILSVKIFLTTDQIIRLLSNESENPGVLSQILTSAAQNRMRFLSQDVNRQEAEGLLWSDSYANHDQVRKMLDHFLAALKPRYRKAVEEYYFGESTFEQVGNILGVNKSWAREIIYKALRQLRTSITPLDFIPEVRSFPIRVNDPQPERATHSDRQHKKALDKRTKREIVNWIGLKLTNLQVRLIPAVLEEARNERVDRAGPFLEERDRVRRKFRFFLTLGFFHGFTNKQIISFLTRWAGSATVLRERHGMNPEEIQKKERFRDYLGQFEPGAVVPNTRQALSERYGLSIHTIDRELKKAGGLKTQNLSRPEDNRPDHNSDHQDPAQAISTKIFWERIERRAFGGSKTAETVFTVVWEGVRLAAPWAALFLSDVWNSPILLGVVFTLQLFNYVLFWLEHKISTRRQIGVLVLLIVGYSASLLLSALLSPWFLVGIIPPINIHYLHDAGESRRLQAWFDWAGEFVRVRWERRNEVLFPSIQEHWKVLNWPWIIRTHKPRNAAEWWEFAFDYGLLLLFTYGFSVLLSIPLVNSIPCDWLVAVISILVAVFPAHLFVDTIAVLLGIRTLTEPKKDSESDRIWKKVPGKARSQGLSASIFAQALKALPSAGTITKHQAEAALAAAGLSQPKDSVVDGLLAAVNQIRSSTQQRPLVNPPAAQKHSERLPAAINPLIKAADAIETGFTNANPPESLATPISWPTESPPIERSLIYSIATWHETKEDFQWLFRAIAASLRHAGSRGADKAVLWLESVLVPEEFANLITQFDRAARDGAQTVLQQSTGLSLEKVNQICHFSNQWIKADHNGRLGLLDSAEGDTVCGFIAEFANARIAQSRPTGSVAGFFDEFKKLADRHGFEIRREYVTKEGIRLGTRASILQHLRKEALLSGNIADFKKYNDEAISTRAEEDALRQKNKHQQFIEFKSEGPQRAIIAIIGAYHFFESAFLKAISYDAFTFHGHTDFKRSNLSLADEAIIRSTLGEEDEVLFEHLRALHPFQIYLYHALQQRLRDGRVAYVFARDTVMGLDPFDGTAVRDAGLTTSDVDTLVATIAVARRSDATVTTLLSALVPGPWIGEQILDWMQKNGRLTSGALRVLSNPATAATLFKRQSLRLDTHEYSAQEIGQSQSPALDIAQNNSNTPDSAQAVSTKIIWEKAGQRVFGHSATAETTFTVVWEGVRLAAPWAALFFSDVWNAPVLLSIVFVLQLFNYVLFWAEHRITTRQQLGVLILLTIGYPSSILLAALVNPWSLVAIIPLLTVHFLHDARSIQAKRPADLLNTIIGQAINKNIGQKFSSQDALKRATPEELEALVRELEAKLRLRPADVYPEEALELAEVIGAQQGRMMNRDQILREKLQTLARLDDLGNLKRYLAKTPSQRANLIVDEENKAPFENLARALGDGRAEVSPKKHLFIDGGLNQVAFEESLADLNNRKELKGAIFVLPKALVAEISSSKGLPGSLLYRVNYITLEDLLSNMPEVQVRNLGLVIGIARIVSIGA